MKQQTSFFKVALSFLVAVCFLTPLKAEKHYVPGMGTYGVTNEKTTCSRCGATYTKGDGHWCERPDRTTHHTSSSSSATDREAQGLVSGDPTLLVNQTSYDFSSTPNAGAAQNNNYSNNSTSTNKDEGRSVASKILGDFRNGSLHEKKSHTGRNILLGLAVLAGAWWFLKRRNK